MGLTDAGITEARSYETAVDQPPSIVSTPNPFFIQGTAGTYDLSSYVSDDGVSSVTYSLNNPLPNGLSLVAETGILNYDGVAGNSVSSHQLVATDSAGNAQSETFLISINSPFDDFSDLPGNIENFGAVTQQDVVTAVQAALDSGHAVFVPPYEYNYGATMVVNEPTIVVCFGEMSLRTNEPVGGTGINVKRNGEQARFMATVNVNAFEVHNILRWQGGCFDWQNLTTFDSNAFYIPMDWLGGEYGGSIKYVRIFGRQSQLQTTDGMGGWGVYVDFENQTVDGAKLEQWHFVIESRHIQGQISLTDYNPGYNQNSAMHVYTADFHHSERAIHDPVSNDCHINEIWQDTANTFLTEAANRANPRLYMMGSNNRAFMIGTHDMDVVGQDITRPWVLYEWGDANYPVQSTSGWEAGHLPVFGTPAVEQMVSDVEMVFGSVSTV